ncbi:MAG: GNAT family N-acetyltransferase, partial [Verrucomicrobiota bacterium]
LRCRSALTVSKSSMSISVVQAELKHLELLVPLLDAYRVFYSQASDAGGAESFLDERLENQDSVILIALAEGKEAVGFIQLYPSFTSIRMRPIWIINDLYVVPGARRQGVARQLMQAARDVAARTRASSLEFVVGRENTGAKALYESLGCKPDAAFDHYHLDI